MPESRGKCTNATVCSLAQEGRAVEVSGEMKCPECGGKLQPLARADGGGAWGKMMVVGIWVLIAALGVMSGWKLSQMSNVPETPAASDPRSAANLASLDVTDKERQEVLRRIDLMPNVTAANKERLYAYVERAQRIKRVMTVSFQGGGARLPEASIRKIVDESKNEPFAGQARDPVMVFVVLGFADKSGDEKANLQTSHDRAEFVADILHKRCNLANVVQSVPMGASDLFHPQEAAENRLAEVWAVLP